MKKYLKFKRKQAKLTQLQVSKELNYDSAQFVSNWERGISLPPAKELKILAKMYHIDFTELKRIYYMAKVSDYKQSLMKELRSL
jgi:transcriptional regulator with XRE-family HTH domain